LALERIAEVEVARIVVKDLAIVVDEQARRVRAGLEQQEQGRAVRRRRTSPERIRCPRDQRSALLPLADALVAIVAVVVFVALVAFVSIVALVVVVVFTAFPSGGVEGIERNSRRRHYAAVSSYEEVTVRLEIVYVGFKSNPIVVMQPVRAQE